MTQKKITPHPYIPNSVPEVREAMLRYIGVDDVESLYASIPAALRLQQPLNIPEGIPSEYDLKRHIEALINKNVHCSEVASFIGGGLYQHFIPAICDEINGRGEFLTAYAGDTYSDHGKHQAWFEYQSLLAELIEMDVVGFPTYDWTSAVSSSLLMAHRLTGRKKVILPRNLNPDKMMYIQNAGKATLDEIIQIGFDPNTGQMDLDELKAALSEDVAAVYFENPTYFGVLETQNETIIRLAHEAGALAVVGVDPITLGVLASPGSYGADIVCGDSQSLGVHMIAGTGTCGFIASQDKIDVMVEFPTLFETITTTELEGAHGFGWATMDRTSFDKRDESQDFTGTTTGLWAITAAVYMSTLGPQGMYDVGEAILQKTQYAIQQLATIPGVKLPYRDAPAFREFVVNFDDSGKSVQEINQALLEHGVFGGISLADSFPDLGQSALYCVTELTSQQDIQQLVKALREIL